MADSNEYLIFTDPQGKKVIENLRQRFQRKTFPDPIETHIRSAQADVVDYIERCANAAINTQEKKK